MSDASKIYDGIPAFPQNEFSAYTLDRAGLSRRDYFAAAALTGLLAYSHYNDSWGDYHNNSSPSSVADRCLEYADAMIAASKTGGHHG